MSREDKYIWTPKSSIGIEEYVKKVYSHTPPLAWISLKTHSRPSIIDDHDTPWIWVHGSPENTGDPEADGSHAGALLEAKRIWERIKEIETDDSIPNRAKKGQKSKKAVRDEAHDGAKESLKNLSKASKWTVGKWLLFPRHEAVDGLWSTIAQSVVNGPLKDAGVFLTKVAPTPSSGGDFVTHVICLYVHDIYDLDTVRKVCHTLLAEHGIEPSAAKSDLYTLAGIDSNHPTKLRSSIWRPTEVIEGGKEAIEKLKDEYHANKGKAKKAEGGSKPSVGKDGILESDSDDERIVRENKKKRKAATEASEAAKEAKDEVKAKEIKKTPVKKQVSKAMKFKEQDIFAGGSDSE